MLLMLSETQISIMHLLHFRLRSTPRSGSHGNGTIHMSRSRSRSQTVYLDNSKINGSNLVRVDDGRLQPQSRASWLRWAWAWARYPLIEFFPQYFRLISLLCVHIYTQPTHKYEHTNTHGINITKHTYMYNMNYMNVLGRLINMIIYIHTYIHTHIHTHV